MTELYLDFSNWDKDPRQTLPTQEEFTSIVDNFKQVFNKGKIMLLSSVTWANAVTKEDQEVFNFPIYMRGPSNTHYAIARLTYQEWDESKRAWVTKKTWKFADRYYHVNIRHASDEDGFAYDADSEGTFHKRIGIYGHAICSPINSNETAVRSLTDKQLAMMYKAQLVGQNYGSPYQSNITSIHNAWTENVMCDSDGHRIPANAPIPQLLTRQPLRVLRNISTFRHSMDTALKQAANPLDVFVKMKDGDRYIVVRHEQCDELARDNQLSAVYPIITYKQALEIQDRLPRQPIDMIVAGLGSAGSGILDQVARSNLVNSFYLVDPDIIEEKNLRNQWYTNGTLHYTKAEKSKMIIQSCRPREFDPRIEMSIGKFEDAPLQHYSAKYAVAGFDTIKTRLAFLEDIMNGRIETRYLIDTRYDDLTASIYFIDMKDEDQVRRYKAGLDADYAAFLAREEVRKEKENIQNFDQFWAYFTNNDPENFNDCDEKHLAIGAYTQDDINTGADCTYCPLSDSIEECHCGTETCKAHMMEVYERCKEKCKDIRRIDIPAAESSCLRQNFIDIYKYASTFVFAAIREIEAGNPKPFTHVEAQTDKFPSHMVVGK
jgi:hypothetical protein